MAKVYEAGADTSSVWRARLHLGAYRYAEAARLAQTNHQTIVAWLKLVQTDESLAESGTGRSIKLLSYFHLLEIAVVARCRRSGVHLGDLARLHRALGRREMLRAPRAPESRHPFILPSFESTGPRQFQEQGDTLLRALHRGQGGVSWNATVAGFFAQVEYDQHIIARWYPRGREQGVVVDPQLSFGTPVIDGSGIPTYIVSERHTAGETIAELTRDYGLSPRQIAAALKFEQALAVRAA